MPEAKNPDSSTLYPTLVLQQYLLDELSPQKHQEITHALSNDPSLTAKLEKLKAFKQTFPDDFGFAELENKIKYTQKSAFAHMQGFAVAASFSLIALILFVTLSANTDYLGDGIHLKEDIIRLKGLQPELHIYKKNGNAIAELHDNATAYQNDLLQLSYVAAGADYGAIFSIDGNGNLTLHYPESASKANNLNRTGEVHLQFSYALDDAPVFERFFFVSSSTPFDINDLLSKAQQLAGHGATAKTETLTLDDTMQQTSITIKKGSL